MPEKPVSPIPASALALVVIGIGLTMTGRSLDGFVRGLCQGAGMAVILVGVAVLSAHVRGRRDRRGESGGDAGMWLPSRDDDQ
ncbi:hypothetical protein RB608_26715 [Nocardioides sp. LHD-245]|uniref:hypothetical protein n=1 Tax=Nocardioides sp. LHD-245 TaxID=3051387 RepID=UPI0027DFF154|nr:hypothetical protein [Nocardioides sp. LHD-245]